MNLEGSKTGFGTPTASVEFESSVNLEGSKTIEG